MTQGHAVQPSCIDQYKTAGLNSHPDKTYSSGLQYVVGMGLSQLSVYLVCKLSGTHLPFLGDCGL